MCPLVRVEVRKSLPRSCLPGLDSSPTSGCRGRSLSCPMLLRKGDTGQRRRPPRQRPCRELAHRQRIVEIHQAVRHCPWGRGGMQASPPVRRLVSLVVAARAEVLQGTRGELTQLLVGLDLLHVLQRCSRVRL